MVEWGTIVMSFAADDSEFADRQDTGQAGGLSVMDLVFLGFNSRVVAMHRETGDVVWSWKSPKGRSSYVAVCLDGDRVIASVHGYTYCLHLKGTGLGIPSVVTMRGNSGSAGAAAIIAQQQAAAAAGGAAGT